jgi:hypothetical protein
MNDEGELKEELIYINKDAYICRIAISAACDVNACLLISSFHA